MTDIAILHTPDGGDLVLQGVDIAIVNGYENIPYLAMFGGADWWGNEFLPQEQQFNSATQAALYANALNSAGRVAIEKAINQDLAILTANIQGTTFTVVTTIAGPQRLDIEITINGQTFYYNWNPITQQLK